MSLLKKVRRWILASVDFRHTQSRTHLRGATLIEVMVASAIGLALVMAVINSTFQAQKQLKRATLASDWTNGLNLIRASLKDVNFCAQIINAGLNGRPLWKGEEPVSPVDLDFIGVWNSSAIGFGGVGKMLNNSSTGPAVPLNGLLGKSIQLELDPKNVSKAGPSTVNINGVPTQVYGEIRNLNISATRIITQQNLGTPGPAPDLYSGLLKDGSGSSTPDMIQLMLYEHPVTHQLLGCDVNDDTSGTMALDRVTVQNPVLPQHKDHQHAAWLNMALNVNPLGPKDGYPASRIYFGEQDDASMSYDLFNDDQTRKTLTLSLNMPGDNVPSKIKDGNPLAPYTNGDPPIAFEVINGNPIDTTPPTVRIGTVNGGLNTGGSLTFINNRSTSSNGLAQIAGLADSSGTAGNLILAVNNGKGVPTESLRISSNGYVGINSISPRFPLTMDNSSNRTKFALFDDGNKFSGLGADGSNLYFSAGLMTGAGPQMVLTNSSKMGIGTLMPTNALDVNGSVAIGKDFAGGNPAPDSSLIVQKSILIGTTTAALSPLPPLVFADNTSAAPGSGERISLGLGPNALGAKSSTNYVSNGFAIESDLGVNPFSTGGQDNLRIHSASVGTDIVFGYGSSALFQETMRITSDGRLQFGLTKRGGNLPAGASCDYNRNELEIASQNSSGAPGSARLYAYTTSYGSARPFSPSPLDSASIGAWNGLSGSTSTGALVTGGGATLYLNPSGGDVVIGSDQSCLQNPGNLHALHDVVVEGNLRLVKGINAISDYYGNPLSTGGWSSDSRLKKDVIPLDHSLDNILKLRGVSYLWKDSSRGEGKQIGFIAQEVEKVFPELVKADSNGFKSLNYVSLIAPVVEAVKSLFESIKTILSRLTGLDQEVAALKTENSKLKEKMEASEKERLAIRAYLCAKDSRAPFCK